MADALSDEAVARPMDSVDPSSSTSEEGVAVSSAPRSMSRWRRVAIIAAFAIGCLATLRASNYLLGNILNLPYWIGFPLIPVVAMLVWTVPLVVAPSLRDIGSFRLTMSWSVLLVVPVLIVNCVFSQYLALPSRPSWQGWLQLWWQLSWYGFVTGVFEELVFRGYAFRRVPAADRRLVVLISAFCFAIVHLPWVETRPLPVVLNQVAFALVVGTGLGAIRFISGSLAWCMLLHASINASAARIFPGYNLTMLCVTLLVAVASILTLWRHPVFRGRLPDRKFHDAVDVIRPHRTSL